MSAGQPDPQLLSPEQAAQRLNVCKATVFNLIAAGELKSLKVGRLRRVTVSEIRRYINARER